MDETALNAASKSTEPRREQRSCGYLLASLVVLVLAYPFAGVSPVAATLLIALNTATMAAGIYAFRATPKDVWISVSLAVPQFVLAVSGAVLRDERFALPAIILFVLFYAFMVIRLLGYLIRGRRVTLDKLFGAASVYLLLGIAWGSLYVLVDALAPGSFEVAEGAIPTDGAETPDYFYFSFVTLTTLGYGDITPVSPFLRPIVVLEALTGVLYLALLVARLVSLYQPDQYSSDCDQSS